MRRSLIRLVIRALVLDKVIERAVADECLAELDALERGSGAPSAFASHCPGCGQALVLHKSGSLVPAPPSVG